MPTPETTTAAFVGGFPQQWRCSQCGLWVSTDYERHAYIEPHEIMTWGLPPRAEAEVVYHGRSRSDPVRPAQECNMPSDTPATTERKPMTLRRYWLTLVALAVLAPIFGWNIAGLFLR